MLHDASGEGACIKDLWYMIRRMAEQRALLPLAILFTIVRCALGLWLPLLLAEAVDAAIVRADLDSVYAVGWRMLCVCIGMGVFGYAANMLCAVVGQRLALTLREETYSKIGKLSVSQVSQLGHGSLITRLTVDINVCSNLASAMVLLLFEPLTFMIGGIIMMWRIAPHLGMVFVGFVVLQLVVMIFFVYSTAPLFVKVRRKTDALNSRLQSAFAGFRLTKAANMQESEKARMGEDNLALMEASLKVQRRIAIFNPLVMLIMNLAVACVLMLAGNEVATGVISVSMVLSAINYSEQVLLSIASVGNVYRVITETQPSAARIREVIDMAPDMDDGALAWDKPFSELRFENVGFVYPAGGQVFEGLSLALHAGETVALIGPIGCGKTTLASLCDRLFDATEGRILLNGTDIRSWRIADVRSAVALVEKQTAVLEDTLKDNIVFGRDGINDADVQLAVGTAQLEGLVAKKPQGLDTPLYSMGKSLSGGERQRLTIARALAGSPGLLVLDDSTSALDYVTEARFLAALRENYPQMAVLLITNRLASALKADRILVLNGGHIEADGTEAELRESSTLFRDMCDIQEGGR